MRSATAGKKQYTTENILRGKHFFVDMLAIAELYRWCDTGLSKNPAIPKNQTEAK